MPKPNESTILVKIADLVMPKTVRKDLGDIMGLAKSISENGLINPIVVDIEQDTGAVRLVAGYRRVEATKLLKHENIIARTYSNLSEKERIAVGIEEALALSLIHI